MAESALTHQVEQGGDCGQVAETLGQPKGDGDDCNMVARLPSSPGWGAGGSSHMGFVSSPLETLPSESFTY